MGAPEQPDQEKAGSRSPFGEGLSRAVLGITVALVLLAAWLVVGVCLVLLHRKGLEHGMGSLGAAVLAAPATFMPAWRWWGVVRARQGITGALLGHLWVLNGSVGYAVAALALLGLRKALVPWGEEFSWFLALAAIGGFLALFAGLVGVNLWLVRRWLRTEDGRET